MKFIFFIGLIIVSYGFNSSLSNWYKYEDTDCEILFPKIPENDTIVKDLSIGRLTFYLHILKNKQTDIDSNNVYELIKTEYPGDDLKNPPKDIAEHLFQGTISSSLKQTNGKLISQQDISIGDYFGKEIKISFDNGTKLIKMKCFIAKAKVYTVEIVSPTDKELNTNADIFFDSFKVK